MSDYPYTDPLTTPLPFIEVRNDEDELLWIIPPEKQPASGAPVNNEIRQ